MQDLATFWGLIAWTYQGRLQEVNGNKLEPLFEDRTMLGVFSRNRIVVDLDRGVDEKYHVPIRHVQVRAQAAVLIRLVLANRRGGHNFWSYGRELAVSSEIDPSFKGQSRR